MRRATIIGINVTVAATCLCVVDLTLARRLLEPGTPTAYRNSDYFGPGFIDEAADIKAEMITRDDGSGAVYFQNADTSGRWINIRGGNRVTTPENASARNVIYALGGSTTFSGDVPDSMTWPSQLAALVPRNLYRVVNLGVPGATLMSRVERLRALESQIRAGDVLLFYFGVNEALYHREFNEPGVLFRRVPGLWGATYQASRVSNIARLVLRAGQRVRIEPTVSEMFAVQRTLRMMFEARLIADRRDATAVFVLQPNLFASETPQTWDELPPTDISEDLVSSIRHFYASLPSVTPDYLDLADARQIFRDLEPCPYFDWMHVNEQGNSQIAEFMYRELRARQILQGG